MDILREVTAEELNLFISRFKENLPRSLKNLYYIYSAQLVKDVSIKTNKKLSDKVLPTFYVPRNGLKENCTIFGITGTSDHTVWYYTLDESLSEIRECLSKTKLIRWNIGVLFVTLYASQIQPVIEFAKFNRLKLSGEDVRFSYVYLPIEDALSSEIEIPGHLEMIKLEESDAAYCNSLWKYKSEKSEFWIRTLIAVHGGYGLRERDAQEIVSFAIITDHLGIGQVTTIKKAQRKGYGQLVVKYLAKKIAEKGYIPHAYIDHNNVASYAMFSRLGFKKIDDTCWILAENEDFSFQ